jgi:serine phosphatase RsbU (regulator of sigma subunit)
LSQTLSRAAGGGPAELGEAIRSDVARFIGETPTPDDLTILVLRWQGDAPEALSEP